MNVPVPAIGFRLRRLARRLAIAVLALSALLLVVRLVPHPPLSQGVPQSIVVEDAEGRVLRLVLAGDQRYRLWVPLDDMAPALVQGTLLYEDAWFKRHPGVNPASVLRAAWNTYVRGGARVGGSTITMQLARLRWRLDTRTPRGKLVQMARALQLEACYSKHDLLEAYLNLAPYGGNIEGAGAASLIYFRKPAADLTLPEALTLAVLPQAPTRRGRLRAGEHAEASYAGAGLSAARARLYARWRQRHPVDAAQDAAMALPVSLRAPRALPFLAPHFVERVIGERSLHPAAPRLSTTLDLRLQRLLEERVRKHVDRMRRLGLRNASALLVDTRDMGVRALVGSADYFDASIAGQVNGSAAKRSPGSTLKPFIYGLALDQGVLHPATVLRDVPSSFGPYTPENFDGRFLGPVTAADALVRSRNIPAVTVAAQLHQPSLYQFLRNAGVERMASERHYGLALVLGGGEVTMEELARLYAMLGNDGLLKPLRWREQDPAAGGTALLSAEAAFIVRDMLKRNPRPGIGAVAGDAAALPVAWKTGTSWGFRDAWSAGIVGPYVLVVWVGNFDGSPNPALVGADAAAPLFFSIVDGLRASRVDLREPPRRWPLNLKRVEICRASGDLPNAYCPQRGWTWFIPGKSPIRVSTVHRAVAVDRVTGRASCGPYDPARMRLEVYEFWPSDLARVFAQAGLPRRKPPAGADCAAVDGAGTGSPPRIQSPLRAAHYTLRLSHPQQSAIALSASVDADVARVFWFSGDQYLGTAAAGETIMWTPTQAARLRISAVDDHGRADTREVQVDVVQ